MCAMDAVSHGAVRAIPKGSTVGNDDGDATRGRLLRRAAFRITCLLVLVLRNTSSSAALVDLTQGTSRMAISRLVADSDRLTPEPYLRVGGELKEAVLSVRKDLCPQYRTSGDRTTRTS